MMNIYLCQIAYCSVEVQAVYFEVSILKFFFLASAQRGFFHKRQPCNVFGQYPKLDLDYRNLLKMKASMSHLKRCIFKKHN